MEGLEQKEMGNWKMYVQNVLLAIGISLIFVAISAFLFYKTNIPASAAQGFIVAIYILSNLIAGLRMGKQVKKRQYLWGMLIGVTYFVLLLTASLLQNQFTVSDPEKLVLVFVICAGSGMFGGMLS